jgi:hypothetical protein
VFLNGDLYENIYASIRGLCCEKEKRKLKKTFYDLKQENQTWCSKIDTFFQEHGMTRAIPTMTSTY